MMILSMGAGQLDLWSRVSHSLIIPLLPSCFNDDIKIENFFYESLMIIYKGSESIFLICVCNNMILFWT